MTLVDNDGLYPLDHALIHDNNNVTLQLHRITQSPVAIACTTCKTSFSNSDDFVEHLATGNNTLRRQYCEPRLVTSTMRHCLAIFAVLATVAFTFVITPMVIEGASIIDQKLSGGAGGGGGGDASSKAASATAATTTTPHVVVSEDGKTDETSGGGGGGATPDSSSSICPSQYACPRNDSFSILWTSSSSINDNNSNNPDFISDTAEGWMKLYECVKRQGLSETPLFRSGGYNSKNSSATTTKTTTSVVSSLLSSILPPPYLFLEIVSPDRILQEALSHDSEHPHALYEYSLLLLENETLVTRMLRMKLQPGHHDGSKTNEPVSSALSASSSSSSLFHPILRTGGGVSAIAQHHFSHLDPWLLHEDVFNLNLIQKINMTRAAAYRPGLACEIARVKETWISRRKAACRGGADDDVGKARRRHVGVLDHEDDGDHHHDASSSSQKKHASCPITRLPYPQLADEIASADALEAGGCCEVLSRILLWSRDHKWRRRWLRRIRESADPHCHRQTKRVLIIAPAKTGKSHIGNLLLTSFDGGDPHHQRTDFKEGHDGMPTLIGGDADTHQLAIAGSESSKTHVEAYDSEGWEGDPALARPHLRRIFQGLVNTTGAMSMHAVLIVITLDGHTAAYAATQPAAEELRAFNGRDGATEGACSNVALIFNKWHFSDAEKEDYDTIAEIGKNWTALLHCAPDKPPATFFQAFGRKKPLNESIRKFIDAQEVPVNVPTVTKALPPVPRRQRSGHFIIFGFVYPLAEILFETVARHAFVDHAPPRLPGVLKSAFAVWIGVALANVVDFENPTRISAFSHRIFINMQEYLCSTRLPLANFLLPTLDEWATDISKCETFVRYDVWLRIGTLMGVSLESGAAPSTDDLYKASEAVQQLPENCYSSIIWAWGSMLLPLWIGIAVALQLARAVDKCLVSALLAIEWISFSQKLQNLNLLKRCEKFFNPCAGLAQRWLGRVPLLKHLDVLLRMSTVQVLATCFVVVLSRSHPLAPLFLISVILSEHLLFSHRKMVEIPVFIFVLAFL